MCAVKNLMLVTLASLAVCLPERAIGEASGRPNVVVILTDDQGWGDLGIHGNRNVSTPRIDALAREGAQLRHFYVCPVCSPTRAEFLTGRYHPRGGVFSTSAGGERLDLDERTIAELFHEAGYATGAFGKWHNGTQHPYHPNARGFQEFYGFCSGHWGDYFDPMLDHNGEITAGSGYLPDDLTTRAMRFMEEQSAAGKPFFVFLPYNTPHSPMQVPDAFYARFANAGLAQRGTLADKEDPDHTRAALAMCENIDWNVGRVLEHLRATGTADDTIVAYFCDNGPNGDRWNGGMKGRKGSTDEGGVRSPLFIRWPRGILPGTVIEPVAGAIDLLPTLASLAGLELPAGLRLDGVDLSPLLAGGAPDWPERRLFSHWNGRVSVRTDRFRLDAAGELYDMVADPGQLRAVTLEQPQVARQLREAVAAWKRDVLSELRPNAPRPFPVGGGSVTQLPARDALAHGGLKRSNRFPNCSYFTNWRSTGDALTFDVDVLAAGTYAVEVYYACPEGDVGSVLQLQCNGASTAGKVTEAHDPPLAGAEHDRIPRQESYVKAFKPMPLGTFTLKRGRGSMTLRATEIPGSQAIEFRMLVLRLLTAAHLPAERSSP